MAIVVTDTGLRLRLSGFGFGSIYFSLSVAAKMVIRDSWGKENANNSWKSQIISRANSVGAISVSIGGQAKISGRGGEGGFDQ